MFCIAYPSAARLRQGREPHLCRRHPCAGSALYKLAVFRQRWLGWNACGAHKPCPFYLALPALCTSLGRGLAGARAAGCSGCVRGGAATHQAEALPLAVAILHRHDPARLLIRLAQGSGESYYESLNYWTYTDSHHYLDIARDGYISAADVPGLIERGVFADEDAAWDRLVQLVFLPGYPVAVGLMYLLVRDYLLAAFLVSALCFSGAGCLLYSLFRLDYGHAAAIRAVRFLCVLPGSFFFAAPMSEGLFLLCCAGCVYLVRRGKFGLAALSALTGPSRARWG